METVFPFSPAPYSIERRIAGFTPEDQQLVRDACRLSYIEAVKLINEIEGKQHVTRKESDPSKLVV